MRILLTFVVVLGVLVLGSAAFAQTPTPTATPAPTPTPTPSAPTPTPTAVPTYSTPQENAIRNGILPGVNAAKCKRFFQPEGCTSASIVSPGGCVTVTVPQAAGVAPTQPAYALFSNLYAETCQVFPNTQAGVDAYELEEGNQALVDAFVQAHVSQQVDFGDAWSQLDPAVRDSICTTPLPNGLGMPAGCSP